VGEAPLQAASSQAKASRSKRGWKRKGFIGVNYTPGGCGRFS
jgi:hypothetical protein